MAASYPARCTVDDHFNPRAIDIARTLDFVAVRRTEEKVMLGAWARANVQTAILAGDDVPNDFLATLLDWWCGAFNSDLYVIGVNPTFKG